jgi:hypothetical protein
LAVDVVVGVEVVDECVEVELVSDNVEDVHELVVLVVEVSSDEEEIPAKVVSGKPVIERGGDMYGCVIKGGVVSAI